ncbi:hypothetical protein EGR_04771 [Echinococcus granulosus]|uniref:Uncharacterized protein n=1 Tax=Echinococcus granulosus TaxID=6210 RepID=W6V307_ECHGR|nr:hypothetical protein EGR_04771 [Echinococcus granulosus]EUB60389.1 hypothetical protein EGR_04771 [Echinococcus granulosus]
MELKTTFLLLPKLMCMFCLLHMQDLYDILQLVRRLSKSSLCLHYNKDYCSLMPQILYGVWFSFRFNIIDLIFMISLSLFSNNSNNSSHLSGQRWRELHKNK